MPITRISDPIYEYVCDFDGTTAKAETLPEGWCVTNGGGVVACPACSAKTTLDVAASTAAELAAAQPAIVGDAVPVEAPVPAIESAP